MLQREIDDKEATQDISTVYHNINKLDKINRALILLSKLESREIFESKKVNLKERIDKTIENYVEIAASQNITISKSISSGLLIETNDTLLDILIGNLLSNSIKHNYEGGIVDVLLNDNVFVIRNTSTDFPLNVTNVFERFRKNKKSKESIGLGLAIVKKICSLFNFDIKYSYVNEMHNFEVKFR